MSSDYILPQFAAWFIDPECAGHWFLPLPHMLLSRHEISEACALEIAICQLPTLEEVSADASHQKQRWLGLEGIMWSGKVKTEGKLPKLLCLSVNTDLGPCG